MDDTSSGGKFETAATSAKEDQEAASKRLLETLSNRFSLSASLSLENLKKEGFSDDEAAKLQPLAGQIFKTEKDFVHALEQQITVAETARHRTRLLDLAALYEPKTALADQINELLLSKGSDYPAAIVIITDGQDNASKESLLDVAARCRELTEEKDGQTIKYHVPLHIYGVGSSEGGSLKIKSVDCSQHGLQRREGCRAGSVAFPRFRGWDQSADHDEAERQTGGHARRGPPQGRRHADEAIIRDEKGGRRQRAETATGH